MDRQKRIKLLKRMQQILYDEQPTIVLDYLFILQALNTARWEGWQPYVKGSMWNIFLYRRRSIDLKPKTAAAASEGSSSSTVWIVAAPAAVVVAGVVVWVVGRNRGRTVKE